MAQAAGPRCQNTQSQLVVAGVLPTSWSGPQMRKEKSWMISISAENRQPPAMCSSGMIRVRRK